MMSLRLRITLLALPLMVAGCSITSGEEPTPTMAPDSAPTSQSIPPGTGPVTDVVETVECDEAPDSVAIICEAHELIRANYVDEISDQILIDAAIRGLESLPANGDTAIICPLPQRDFVAICDAAAGRDFGDSTFAEAVVEAFAIFGLDPNSAYLDEDALALLQEEQEGEIEGIGALVSPEDETIEGENKQCSIVTDTCRIVIASTIEGTPAQAAGLQAGDVIVAVDGEDIDGWNVDEVTARVRGPAGTNVRLTIERASESFDVTIKRAAVVIPVLEAARFGDDGYIRLRVFNEAADEQFESAVIQLVGEGIDDLVVDLRNNPGGLLDTAIDITSVFLPSGEVVVTEGPNDDMSYSVTGTAVLPGDVDVIFVVNGGSASASEVVSAVLQERDRATIVGENTFGKNTVQQRFNLSNGGALKLTIARWLTPEGLDFGSVGVTPDVEMTLGADTTAEDLVAAVVNLG